MLVLINTQATGQMYRLTSLTNVNAMLYILTSLRSLPLLFNMYLKYKLTFLMKGELNVSFSPYLIGLKRSFEPHRVGVLVQRFSGSEKRILRKRVYDQMKEMTSISPSTTSDKVEN